MEFRWGGLDSPEEDPDRPQNPIQQEPEYTWPLVGDSVEAKGQVEYDEWSDVPEPMRDIERQTVKDSFNSFMELAIMESVKAAADMMHPGLGPVIDIGEQIWKICQGIEAVNDSEAPLEITVPLIHEAGIDIDFHVRLPSRDGTEALGPPINAFLAPSEDSLFGGWEIERAESARPPDKETDNTSQESESSEHPHVLETNTPFIVVERPVKPLPQLGPRSRPLIGRGVERAHAAIVTCNLAAIETIGAIKHDAAILPRAAGRLRYLLKDEPKFRDLDLVVIYDPYIGVGMWLIPEAEPVRLTRAWRIQLRMDQTTGQALVFIDN
jgi:hypothetical protein